MADEGLDLLCHVYGPYARARAQIKDPNVVCRHNGRRVQVVMACGEKQLVEHVHSILFLLRGASSALCACSRSKMTVTSSQGYMYMPRRYPWYNRPFSR